MEDSRRLSHVFVQPCAVVPSTHQGYEHGFTPDARIQAQKGIMNLNDRETSLISEDVKDPADHSQRQCTKLPMRLVTPAPGLNRCDERYLVQIQLIIF